MLIVGMGGDLTLEEKVSKILTNYHLYTHNQLLQLLLKSSGDLSKYSFTPMSPDSETRTRPPQSAKSNYSDSKIKVYETKPRAFVEYILDLKLSKDEISTELENYLAKQETRFQSVINNVKALLDKEKNKNRKLQNNQTRRGKDVFENLNRN